MKPSIIKYISLVIVVFSMAACERVIELDIPEGEPVQYVDAWITTKPGVQAIKFLKATAYQGTQEPTPITGAQITVTDITINQTYPFTYQAGAYLYDAGSTNSIGVVGHKYKLNITWNGEQFEAANEIKRNTTIDSVTVEFREAKSDEKEGYYAKLYAHDLPGATDYYWIRTYRNDSLNYYIPEMLSIDGTFNENISNGFEFIPPFRDGITSGEKPYIKGDKVKVLLRSLSKSSYDFMKQVTEQFTNDGLFSKVLSNVPTNVINQQSTSKTKIYGWFGTVGETEVTKAVQ